MRVNSNEERRQNWPFCSFQTSRKKLGSLIHISLDQMTDRCDGWTVVRGWIERRRVKWTRWEKGTNDRKMIGNSRKSVRWSTVPVPCLNRQWIKLREGAGQRPRRCRWPTLSLIGEISPFPSPSPWSIYLLLKSSQILWLDYNHLAGFLLDLAWILAEFWLNFGLIMAEFWLDFGWNLAEFWPHFCQSLPEFAGICQNPAKIQPKFSQNWAEIQLKFSWNLFKIQPKYRHNPAIIQPWSSKNPTKIKPKSSQNSSISLISYCADACMCICICNFLYVLIRVLWEQIENVEK